MNFATVTNVTKQPSGKITRYPRRKVQSNFQSRLAGDKWLTPYTDVEVNKMPELKSCRCNTCFVSDCLETLEEIAMEAGHEFKENGGEEF
jgi:ferrochelatase